MANDRFDWLSNLIREVQPDAIIDMGDSADMASLYGADLGSRDAEFEGHTYRADIQVYHDSRSRLARGINKLKNRPRLVKTEGNHEYRISRLVKHEPKLNGHVSSEDLRDKSFGWNVSPFLVPVYVDGVSYCHYWKAPGGKDRAISGVVVTRSVLQKYPGSYSRVFGHSHRFEWFETPAGDGTKITCINAGCYFDPRGVAHAWASTDVHGWRSGILQLSVDRGQVHAFQWRSYQDLKGYA